MAGELLNLDLDSLHWERITRINDLADRFEDEFRSGSGPSPDSFVSELDDPHERLVLLRWLA